VKKSIASEPTPPSLAPVDGAIEADLTAVENRLSPLLDSNEAHIAEICHYLIDGSGKRLRPTFILLVYRACGGGEGALRDVVDAATALELIHSATLLHDDIIDAGVLRRGRPSAYARYGPAPTLVAGDYLFCRAFEICGRFDEPLVLTAARACIQLTEGEAMEGRLRYNPGTSLDQYLTVITRKTASLFAAGGKVAADLAGAPPAICDAMSRLGKAVGLAFQMVDDLLDILGPEEKIGKPVGSDLRAGIPSLPMVLAAEHNPELRAMFRNGAGHDDAVFKRTLELLREPQIIARARAMAAEQVQRAGELLTMLRPSAYRDRLSAVIDEQVRREV
jgi:geranylgeranyl pyrophosphate synthase